METYQQQMAGPLLQMSGVSKFPMWFVSAKDYGKQVVKSFEILNDSESKNYIIQGLEPFDYQQANQIFIQNYSKKLWLLTVPSFMLSLAAKFSQKMNYLGNIMESLNSYPETFQAESTWQELGKPEITLAEFAKNYWCWGLLPKSNWNKFFIEFVKVKKIFENSGKKSLKNLW